MKNAIRLIGVVLLLFGHSTLSSAAPISLAIEGAILESYSTRYNGLANPYSSIALFDITFEDTDSVFHYFDDSDNPIYTYDDTTHFNFLADATVTLSPELNGIVSTYALGYEPDMNWNYAFNTKSTPDSISIFSKDGYYSFFIAYNIVSGDFSGDFTINEGDDGYGSYGYGGFSIGTAKQPIPEPTTMLLLGAGLIGLAGVRRNRKEVVIQ